jgi:arginine N-succinyltransferase
VFRLRAARLEDVDALYALATTALMLNLPADREDLTHRVEHSMAAFAGNYPDGDIRRGEYVFVLEDFDAGGRPRVIGTSAIIGQHGTKQAPHISFEIGTEENYSASLDKRIVLQTLELVHSYEGPTEIGGLLLDPKNRKTVTETGVRLGTQLSFVRFLYMAMRPERFQPLIIAEMMPPFVNQGTSPLWDAVGAKFTGLTYAEADERWRVDKDFVQQLFPSYPIYISLLPPAAQAVIGAVDENTKPALKLLESVGFRFMNHVDPFDGGPHYSVKRDEITLVKRSVKRKLIAGDVLSPTPALIGVEPGGDKNATFRAVATQVEIGETTATVAPDRFAALEVAPGTEATITPLA